MCISTVVMNSHVQRKPPSNTEESDGVPEGIVLDITLVKGQRVVTVRSPVQVCNTLLELHISIVNSEISISKYFVFLKYFKVFKIFLNKYF